VQRDRHAELLNTLALIGASLEKFAVEIRGLQRTEVMEVEEPFGKGQKGSSAMPHKRNPITCERITGLARLLRGNAMAALENVALWHERDISHSSVERVIVPDSFILLDYMLHQFTRVMAGLHVYPENMLRNLARTEGLIFSQQVLLALTQKGMAREEAYTLVQGHALAIWQEQQDNFCARGIGLSQYKRCLAPPQRTKTPRIYRTKSSMHEGLFMSAKKKKKLYEGRTKTLYETEAPEQLILTFRDDVLLPNNKMLAVEGKGEVNNHISALLCRYLESYHIPTHFVEIVARDSMTVRTLEMIPVGLVLHNLVGPALAKRAGIKEGKVLEKPLMEYRFKDETRTDDFPSRNDVLAAGLITSPDLHILERYANKINVLLKSFFLRRGFILESVGLDFGRYKNRMVLGNELSLDTCQLLEAGSGDKVFSSRSYSDPASLQKVYREVGSRILSVHN
jgi:adenylosuccinate lyase